MFVLLHQVLTVPRVYSQQMTLAEVQAELPCATISEIVVSTPYLQLCSQTDCWGYACFKAKWERTNGSQKALQKVLETRLQAEKCAGIMHDFAPCTVAG